MKDLIYTRANKGDKSQLIELWLSCFDEIPSALEIFFEYAEKNARIFCAKRDNQIISALYLLGVKLAARQANYLFAAATLKEYRGKGIMGKLIEYSMSEAQKDGDVFSLLLPAGDGLYKFYARFGYQPLCFMCEHEYTRESLKNFRLLRSDCAYTQYDEKFLCFAQKYYCAYGLKCIRTGGVFAIIDENSESARVIYYECASETELVREILKNTSASKICVRSGSCNSDSRQKYGMIKQLDPAVDLPDNTYIGITFE